ncbi:MAG TPA: hypothetical protein VEL47_07285, partial [Myxococcota bacterium]|nr:hypothetical protein [Myxococcota bacterium]
NSLENQLGTLSNAPITIWLHASNEDKLAYTGAKNVHFALPKHREIHISGSDVPHDVLGHELAHIDVGDFSKTVLGLPGENLLIPNLALTEGIPMALTKELYLENGLTLIEQAQALYQGDFRVNLDDLFSANPFHFAKAQPRISYIYAGAMIDFFLAQWPREARASKLREMIASGSLSGEIFDSVKTAFMERLKQPVGPDAILWAKRSFKGSSILLADCTEQSYREKAELNIAALNLDFDQFSRILSRFSPSTQKALLDRAIDHALTNLQSSFALSLINLRKALPEKDNDGDASMLAFKELSALVGNENFVAASVALNRINEEYFLPPQKRLLTIMRVLFHSLYAGEHVQLSKAAIGFLVSRPSNEEPKIADLAYYFGQDRRTSGSTDVGALVQYILSRFYLRQHDYEEAKNLISQVLAEKAHLPSLVEREAHFMSAKIDIELGNAPSALATLDHLLHTSISEGEREQITAMIARLRFGQREEVKSR